MGMHCVPRNRLHRGFDWRECTRATSARRVLNARRVVGRGRLKSSYREREPDGSDAEGYVLLRSSA